MEHTHTFDRRGDGKSGTCLDCHQNIQPVFVSKDVETPQEVRTRTAVWFKNFLAKLNIGISYCENCYKCFDSRLKFENHNC